MHEAAASENREETATTGIELNQIEKHGANLCLFDREIQIQCRLFAIHLKYAPHKILKNRILFCFKPNY